MPSEKSRYMRKHHGPTSPLTFESLREHIPTLGVARLTELLWVRAQEDDVLQKALTASIAIRTFPEDISKAKAAVDYALHFPDYVRYTEGGHGLILDEIQSALEFLESRGKRYMALDIAQHAIHLGQEVAENFEDDWDWTSSLKDLIEWTEKKRDSL